MLQLIYTSVATKPLSDSELNKILNQSRLRNEFVQITGMLLYDRGTFLQVIEGPEDAVRRLFARIKEDTRHQRLIVLSDRTIKHREFSQWRMGYVHMTPNALLDLPGYENYFEGEAELSHCRQDAWLTRKILEHFRDGLWKREQAA